jgi:hypothetical protein
MSNGVWPSQPVTERSAIIVFGRRDLLRGCVLQEPAGDAVKQVPGVEIGTEGLVDELEVGRQISGGLLADAGVLQAEQRADARRFL